MSTAGHLPKILQHFRRAVETGLARGYGPDDNRMWMSSLDTRTGRYPEHDERPDGISKRCYRWIEAPRGCNLYWDTPQLVAALNLARLEGGEGLELAAGDYVRDFLARCVAPTGMLLWGNHYYYDAFQGCTLSFTGSRPPTPCDMASETGDLHEARPIPPAWELLWRVDPAQTERAIRVMLQRHLFDPAAGGFNRHADGKSGCAFLEAGGILVESAAWLHEKTGDCALLDRAAHIAAWSFNHRSPATGLLENNPTQPRWDKVMATSEVGLWGGSLLRASGRLPVLRDMARRGVAAWVTPAYDAAARRYYGRLRVADAAPDLGPKTTEYQPGEHSDFWDPLFPAHDYPFQMAECCVELSRLTGEALFSEAVRRWADSLLSRPPRDGRGGYAEHYGRAIHFLLRASDLLAEPVWSRAAQRLADDAVRHLWTGEMFRSHPGEDRCDAVDGLGYLALALVRLELGREPEMFGSGW